MIIKKIILYVLGKIVKKIEYINENKDRFNSNWNAVEFLCRGVCGVIKLKKDKQTGSYNNKFPNILVSNNSSLFYYRQR